ncbi:hypothetical protein TNCV_3424931 [Trichonephila clavipes]|nr:hypothetical protein TNCV_3424931 [Trichonephila clavipes]
MLKSSSFPIRLNRFLGLFAFENVLYMLAQRLARDTPPTATLDQLWQHVEDAWIAVLQGYIQSLFDSMPRRAVPVLAYNGGYSKY